MGRADAHHVHGQRFALRAAVHWVDMGLHRQTAALGSYQKLVAGLAVAGRKMGGEVKRHGAHCRETEENHKAKFLLR